MTFSGLAPNSTARWMMRSRSGRRPSQRATTLASRRSMLPTYGRPPVSNILEDATRQLPSAHSERWSRRASGEMRSLSSSNRSSVAASRKSRSSKPKAIAPPQAPAIPSGASSMRTQLARPEVRRRTMRPVPMLSIPSRSKYATHSR